MDSVQATRLRKGMIVKLQNELYRLLEVNNLTPGKGKALVQSKRRHVKDSTLRDNKFRTADIVERVALDVAT